MTWRDQHVLLAGQQQHRCRCRDLGHGEGRVPAFSEEDGEEELRYFREDGRDQGLEGDEGVFDDHATDLRDQQQKRDMTYDIGMGASSV